jgi:trigger factor
MQSTLEETDRHTVRILVEVPFDEVERGLDRAYRKVGAEVTIPGFRRGKVPRRIIDARVGRDAVYHEFVEEFVPEYYVQALQEHELAPIGEPEIDIDGHAIVDGEPFRFSATVEVRPRLVLEPEQYRGVKVDAPSPEPTEHDVDVYVDRLRERFAELEAVSRPARTGDFVLSDVRAYRHDQEVPEATRPGFMTEVGKEELVPELDKELEGKRKGDILKFNATLPEAFGEAAGTEVTLQVLVKEVKAKKLPASDDEFAKTASEFDTMAELRADVREKLGEIKAAQVQGIVRDLVLRKVVDSVEVDLPERLVDDETSARIERGEQRAQQVGMTLAQLLELQGFDELQFRADARAHAVRAIKLDLVLEAVARAEELHVDREDLDREVAILARETGRDPKEVRRLLERTGQMATLVADLVRSKAADVIVEAAEINSTDTPVDLDEEGEDEAGSAIEDVLDGDDEQDGEDGAGQA